MEKVTTIETDTPVVVEKKTDQLADVLREKARTSLDHNVSTVLTVLADSIDDHYATKQGNKVVSVPVPVPGTAIVSEPVAVQETGPATFVAK